MRREPKSDDLFRNLASRLDVWTIGIAVGCVSMLVVIQALLAVPGIHNAVDSWRSGFVTVPTTNQPANQQATVQLSLAPDTVNSDVSVLVDGTKVADFGHSTSVNISLQSGQNITIQNDSSHQVYVTVNQSDASLVVPAPGQRVIVSPNSLANFPAAAFQNPVS